MTQFSSIEDAILAIANGRIVIVVDAEDREDEGDFIAAAEAATAETIHFMISQGRGQLCMPVLPETADRLQLQPMVAERCPTAPRFAIPVDHRDCKTGISPHERAFTIRAMIDPETTAEQFIRPGHIFPLIARSGGVLERPGHTEAAVDLARLAGFEGSGLLCEICSRDGQHMAKVPELMDLADVFDLPIITIDRLIEYRRTVSGILDDVLESTNVDALPSEV